MRVGLVLGLLLVMAACERTPPDPLAGARATCASDSAEAEARMEACSRLLDSGELSDTEKSTVLAQRGIATAEAGEVTDALRDFNAALQLTPDNADAALGRAQILTESGQLDAAEPLVQRLISGGEHVAAAERLGGDIARMRGDGEAAIAAYGRAIELDGRNALAYAGRAHIKQGQRDYAAALADFDAALRINPQLTPALAGRCWTRVLMDVDNVAPARRDADEAAQADPRDVQAQLCRGVLQLRAGEWADARASYEAVLEVEPGNPAALFGRGVARRRSGDSQGREDMNLARDFDRHIGETFDDLGVDTY